MNFNKVILAGNLTRDPELKHLPSGTALASFGLAINRKWKSDAGEAKEEVTFLDCAAFGRTAEVIAQYFRKGRPILVEGRLQQERWQDKATGQDRQRIKVVVESFSFAGGKADGGAPARAAAAPAEAPGKVGEDDDVPF